MWRMGKWKRRMEEVGEYSTMEEVMRRMEEVKKEEGRS